MNRGVGALGLLAAALVSAGAFWVAGVSASADTTPQPPHITTISPGRVPTGAPIRVTITGVGFTGASSVTTDPPGGSQLFQVFNDNTILLVLPADTRVGDYVIHVSSPAGGDVAPTTLIIGPKVAPKPVVAPDPVGAPARPPVSLQPAPRVAATAAPVISSATAGESRPITVSPRAAPEQSVNPVVAALLGFAIGGLLFVLWGREGRLRLARRHGLLAQLWGRPVQRMRLGRICLHCGRLHYLLRTRRDLWKAGRFCSATCFIADQEAELVAASSEEMAPSRMRGVGIYVDMEQKLQAALRGEAAEHASDLFGTVGSTNPALHVGFDAVSATLAEPAHVEPAVTIEPAPFESPATAAAPPLEPSEPMEPAPTATPGPIDPAPSAPAALVDPAATAPPARVASAAMPAWPVKDPVLDSLGHPRPLPIYAAPKPPPGELAAISA